MPTYEYGCTACGHEWELTQRITEAPVELCPRCAKAAAHRLISGGTNFILKGGGWYSDLYSSSKPAAKKAEANGGEGSDGAAKTEPKADAKGDSTAGAKGANGDTKPAASTPPSKAGTPSKSGTPATPSS
jgi:putative FmdB family regulatory protein